MLPQRIIDDCIGSLAAAGNEQEILLYFKKMAMNRKV
jgi:hypothetical protein